jgi:hypothetical protein
MVKGLIAIIALAGCFEDRYRCETDNDCDLGAGGRCAPDGHCTVFDADCAAERRYSAHSGDRSGQCFDDRRALANLCAAGQAPAIAEGCAADVCEALPACCETGWSEACVREAQRRCPVACDTRIAITAQRGVNRVLWDLRWASDTQRWSATRSDREVLLAWLAPEPDGVTPRLAGFGANGELVVDERAIAIGGAREYRSLTSIDLDRLGRDSVTLAYEIEGPSMSVVMALELDTGSQREIEVTASEHVTWGDDDRDGFPDGIAGSNARYTLLDNFDGVDHVRSLASATSNTVTIATPGAPPLRGFDWLDVDGDRRLDLAVFGSAVRVHTGSERIRDTPVLTLDCMPPRRDTSGCVLEDTALAGAALPRASGPGLVMATFPMRGVWQVAIADGNPTVTQIPFAEACAGCAPIIAVVTRDLDGDQELDIVGIDARLGIYTALSSGDGRLARTLPIPDPGMTYQTIETSVTGAPR